MNSNNFILLVFAAVFLFFAGCVKDKPDEPESSNIPFDDTKVLTIGQLKNIYTDSAGAYTFTDNWSFYARVGMDERSGNIYKSSYVQDQTGGIQLNYLNPGGIYLGDSIRVLLKGATLDVYHDLFQINNIDQGRSILKLATQKYIAPKVLSIQELISNIDYYQSTVIKLEDVQFLYSELGETFADSVNKIDENRAIEDCEGTSIIIRTSGYADFANTQVPEGNGSLIAIATVYTSGSNVTPQLVVRELSEVAFTGSRCQGVVVDPVSAVGEDFSGVTIGSNLTLTGWTNFVVAGNERWRGEEFGGNQYAEAEGYGTGLDNMEVWLITPPVINTSGEMILSFRSNMAYWEHTNNLPLEVFASIDFDGSNFGSSNWTKLSPVLPNSSSGNYNFIESGEISLADFVGNVSIAFRYKGSSAESTTVQLDDVKINNGGEPILSETFDNGWGGWISVSKSGAQTWSRDNVQGPDGSPCAEMNGFSTVYHINNDWLISPSLTLSGYTSLRLSFESARNFDGEDIRVKITGNYTGDPTSTTWTVLDANLSAGSFIWTPSGSVSISGISGSDIRVAFEYNSSATDGATWRIDNVNIKAN